jgi:Tol biopolymer transport system component
MILNSTDNRARITRVVFAVSAGLFAVLLLVMASCSEKSLSPGKSVPPPIDNCPRWYGEDVMYFHFGVVQIDANGRTVIDGDLRGLWRYDMLGASSDLIFSAAIRNFDISVDGGLIVFQLEGEIFTAGLTPDSVRVETVRQLTADGLNFFPSLSPSSTEVAYDNRNCNNGDFTETCGVCVIEVDGTNKRIVARGRMPDWSPDGRHLIYRGYKGELYRVAVDDTSDIEQLTDFNSTREIGQVTTPRYSRDGSKIVFSLETKSEVWMMNAGGENLRKITDGSQPELSPSNEQIVFLYSPPGDFQNRSTVWIIGADGEGRYKLTSGP